MKRNLSLNIKITYEFFEILIFVSENLDLIQLPI